MSHPALRAASYYTRAYRRTWRGTMLTTFVNPVLFLLAMGVGLGTFIKQPGQTASLGHLSYLKFVAPGMAIATAVQVAAGEATFPVMGATKWHKTYFAMIATPLRVGDVLAGNLIWMGIRVTMSVFAYLVVMALFGATTSPEAIAILPVAVLTGAAFATPLAAFSVAQENDGVFSLIFRLGIVPLFLFSAVFFPLSQMPVGLRILAYCTPMWHGVDLCRALAYGRATAGGTAEHLAYLLGLAVLGFFAARLTYHRRLVV